MQISTTKRLSWTKIINFFVWTKENCQLNLTIVICQSFLPNAVPSWLIEAALMSFIIGHILLQLWRLPLESGYTSVKYIIQESVNEIYINIILTFLLYHSISLKGQNKIFFTLIYVDSKNWIGNMVDVISMYKVVSWSR